MATTFGSVRQLVHDTAAGLVDNAIPTKIAGSINGLVTSGFGIVTDVLAILRDLMKPDPPTPPAPGH
jgi:hypothetical protein